MAESKDGVTESERDGLDDDAEELKALDELFKNRFSDADPDYVKAKKESFGPPPAIYPWFSRPKRNFDYANKRRDRSRDDGGGGRWNKRSRDDEGGGRWNKRSRDDEGGGRWNKRSDSDSRSHYPGARDSRHHHS